MLWGDGTRGFVHTRYVLSHLSYSPNLPIKLYYCSLILLYIWGLLKQCSEVLGPFWWYLVKLAKWFNTWVRNAMLLWRWCWGSSGLHGGNMRPLYIPGTIYLAPGWNFKARNEMHFDINSENICTLFHLSHIYPHLSKWPWFNNYKFEWQLVANNVHCSVNNGTGTFTLNTIRCFACHLCFYCFNAMSISPILQSVN